MPSLYNGISAAPVSADPQPTRSGTASAATSESVKSSSAKPLAKVGSQPSIGGKAAPEPEDMSIKVDDSKQARMRDEKSLKAWFCSYLQLHSSFADLEVELCRAS
jgi:hypothetical protein